MSACARIAALLLLSGLSSFVHAQAVDVTPRQLHLALAGEDASGSAMRVSYMTVNASASTCSWGPAGQPFNSSATGTSAQYITDGGWHHVVKLAGLAPGANISYSCGGSPPTTFTAPIANGNAQPFTAVIFGDWGFENSTSRGAMLPVGGLVSNWTANPAYDLLVKLSPSAAFTWIVGDIAYADDSFGHINELLGFGYEKAMNGFMSSDWLGAVANKQPVMVSPGNHES